MALPQLFSIGETAKIFHLSVSSLRHYEALGLVTPEYVDPSTNYRYYSVRQFEPLNTIRYLRALDYSALELSTSRLAAAQAEALVFLGKVGFSVSQEHLNEGSFGQYDGEFLVLDEADRFAGDVIDLPASLCARVRFRGHHAESPAQYRRLMQFIREEGYTAAGFSREITVIDYGFTTDTEKFVTEIMIPLQKV